MNKEKVAELCAMYGSGLSIHKLSRVFAIHRRTVMFHLRQNGFVLPERLGKDVERAVARRLSESGAVVTTQPENAPYDLLVDGLRVDVKSASRSRHRGGTRYIFQLQDVTERKKVKAFDESVDYFYLAFLDAPNRPVYALSTHQELPQSSLSVTDIERCKYPLEFVCNLEIEVTKSI